jgi:hypothetical protein
VDHVPLVNTVAPDHHNKSNFVKQIEVDKANKVNLKKFRLKGFRGRVSDPKAKLEIAKRVRVKADIDNVQTMKTEIKVFGSSKRAVARQKFHPKTQAEWHEVNDSWAKWRIAKRDALKDAKPKEELKPAIEYATLLRKKQNTNNIRSDIINAMAEKVTTSSNVIKIYKSATSKRKRDKTGLTREDRDLALLFYKLTRTNVISRLSESHRDQLVKLITRCGDVEKNPGPTPDFKSKTPCPFDPTYGYKLVKGGPGKLVGKKYCIICGSKVNVKCDGTSKKYVHPEVWVHPDDLMNQFRATAVGSDIENCDLTIVMDEIVANPYFNVLLSKLTDLKFLERVGDRHLITSSPHNSTTCYSGNSSDLAPRKHRRRSGVSTSPTLPTSISAANVRVRNSFRATNYSDSDSRSCTVSSTTSSECGGVRDNKPPLQGYVIPNEDVKDYVRFATNREPIDAVQTTAVLPYDQEKRLCVNRGVLEIKQDLRLCKINYSIREYYFNAHPYYTTLYMLIALLAIGFCEWLITTRAGALFQEAANYNVSIVVEYRDGFHLTPYQMNYTSFNRLRVVYLLLLVLLKWLVRKVIKNGQHVYCPHWVSSALTECDILQPMDVAALNIEHAIRRIACLPVPDVDHIHISHTSGLVTMHAIHKRNFQAGPVPCVAGLVWIPT